MLTLSQIEQYVRAETGEMDSGKVDSEQIKRYVNFEQLHIQNELSLIGFKYFTKTAFYDGSVFEEPTDLMKYPNSIINLLGSSGVKATVVGQNETDTVIQTHAAKNVGTEWNGWTFVYLNTGSVSVSINWNIKTVTLGFNASVTTNTVFIAALNANTTYSTFWTASSNTTGSTVMDATMAAETSTAGGTLTWYAADEVSNENFVRIEANAYKAPTTTSPKYRRIGNNALKLIEVLPRTTKYIKIEYYFRLADLSATTDTLAVPAEVEELVLLGVQMRIYEKLGNTGAKQSTATEYEMKWKKYVESYTGKRESETAEKQRLQSADVNN